jgi:hypothetical protein
MFCVILRSSLVAFAVALSLFIARWHFIFADHRQVELRAPATDRLRPIEEVLGLDESKSEQPSFTDTQIIDQLIGQQLRNPFVLLNPTSNNMIWVNPVAASQKATLPFRYEHKIKKSRAANVRQCLLLHFVHGRSLNRFCVVLCVSICCDSFVC